MHREREGERAVTGELGGVADGGVYERCAAYGTDFFTEISVRGHGDASVETFFVSMDWTFRY